MVRAYKYLGLQVDDKLYWSANTDSQYRKGQNWLYFLWRVGTNRKLLLIFYQSVAVSVIICHGLLGRQRDWTSWWGELAMWFTWVSPQFSHRKRTLNKLLSIIEQCQPPSAQCIHQAKEYFQWWTCSTNRLRKSFVPQYIRLLNWVNPLFTSSDSPRQRLYSLYPNVYIATIYSGMVFIVFTLL